MLITMDVGVVVSVLTSSRVKQQNDALPNAVTHEQKCALNYEV